MPWLVHLRFIISNGIESTTWIYYKFRSLQDTKINSTLTSPAYKIKGKLYWIIDATSTRNIFHTLPRSINFRRASARSGELRTVNGCQCLPYLQVTSLVIFIKFIICIHYLILVSIRLLDYLYFYKSINTCSNFRVDLHAFSFLKHIFRYNF